MTGDHTLTDSPLQRCRADLLALVAAVLHDPYDSALLEDDAVCAVMDSVERCKPLDVAFGATTLVLSLLREVAALTDQLPEDVLQRLALSAAESPLPPINP